MPDQKTKFDDGRWKHEIRKVSDLHPNPDNPRTITKETLKGLKRSMKKNRYTHRIIVDCHNMILSGHARWLVFKEQDPDAEIELFLTRFFDCAYHAMREGATAYVFYKEMGHGTFMRAMRFGGLTYKQEIIWEKDQLVLGGSKYQGIYEPFLMGCKGDSIKTWNGGRKQVNVLEGIDLMSEEDLRKAYKELLASIETDVIEEERTKKNDKHPTMKPVKLLARLIRNSSNVGDIVLDLFGGSGSTMMACEQIGRKCYMNELDPHYCDVIIERWEQMTGKKATKLN